MAAASGGSDNAVREIGSQPFGKALLIITGIGLFGYALWRFVQAALDPEGAGTDKKGIVKRIGYATSGVIHTFLGITAMQLATGGGGGGSSKKTWIAKLMAVDTVGPFLVGFLGAVVCAYALYQIKKGWTLKFKEELKTGEMSEAEVKAVTVAGRIGLIARGIVFGIVGGYLIKAAISAQPGQAKTFGGRPVRDRFPELRHGAPHRRGGGSGRLRGVAGGARALPRVPQPTRLTRPVSHYGPPRRGPVSATLGRGRFPRPLPGKLGR